MSDQAANIAGNGREDAWAIRVVNGFAALAEQRDAENEQEQGNGVPSLLNGRILGDIVNLIGVFVTAAGAATLAVTGNAMDLFVTIGLLGFSGLLLALTAGFFLLKRFNRKIRTHIPAAKLKFYSRCLLGQSALIVFALIVTLAVFLAGQLTIAVAMQIAALATFFLVCAQVIGQILFVVRDYSAIGTLKERRAAARDAARHALTQKIWRQRLRLLAAIVLNLGLAGIAVGLLWSFTVSFMDPSAGVDVPTIVGSVGWLLVEAAIIVGFCLSVNKERVRFDKVTPRPAPGWLEILAVWGRSTLIVMALAVLIFLACVGYRLDAIWAVVGLGCAGVLLGLVIGVGNIRAKLDYELREDLREGDRARRNAMRNLDDMLADELEDEPAAPRSLPIAAAPGRHSDRAGRARAAEMEARAAAQVGQARLWSSVLDGFRTPSGTPPASPQGSPRANRRRPV